MAFKVRANTASPNLSCHELNHENIFTFWGGLLVFSLLADPFHEGPPWIDYCLKVGNCALTPEYHLNEIVKVHLEMTSQETYLSITAHLLRK